MKSVKLPLIIFAIVLAGIFLFWNNLADFYFPTDYFMLLY